jgi:hypothetical protein
LPFPDDWLKTETPFWKSEETAVGERWVKAGAKMETPKIGTRRTQVEAGTSISAKRRSIRPTR